VSLQTLFGALAGMRIPGGCDTCEAYQTLESHEGIHVLTVHHDNGCPTLRRHTR
jgi:hypothetical protein